MNKDWLILVRKFDIESSRIKFENICEKLFKKIYPNKTVRTVSVSQGDGGIDIFIGEIGIEAIDVIQCKFFVNGINESQKNQIRESFKTTIESTEYKTKSWTLCVINSLDLSQNIWWSTWKNNVKGKYQLPDDFINLKDGNELIDLLKEYNLYVNSFELEDSIKLDEIHNKIVKENTVPEINIVELLKRASYPLLQVRNFFENKTNTHIERNETKSIYEWIVTQLPSKQKNVLILNGEKGLGKSTIQKDLYEKLDQENYRVIGIKADKFYSKSITDLENKLFASQLTFDLVIKDIEEKGNKLIVIIDQIDALSLTLSSSREFIETYNNLILHLQNNKNVRIIISSRSYDLKYDAELSIYNSDEYRKVTVNPLSIEDVKQTLSAFNINCSSHKVLELLRIPNHLDIYCRIFDGNSKKDIDSISSLKDLYDQLWKKYIITQRDLNLKKLIYVIAQRMYTEQRISIGNIYEDEFFQEMLYLNSNSLLVEYNQEIQFFHQTFYEYCFAKQFVENQENIENYILDNEQSLYVRSVIKMVLEYLREYDINKYVETIKSILSSLDYRFHVKSLIISNIGGIKNPSILEKELIFNIILKNTDYEEVFVSSIFSQNWLKFLILENIPEKYFSIKKNENDSEEQYSHLKEKFFNYNWLIFMNNMNECPIIILNYLDSLDFENKENFITRLLIQIDDWSDDNLLKYFEKYMPYKSELKRTRDNFWFFEILKKIFPNNREYAFDKLIEPILEIYEIDKINDEFEHSLNTTIKEFYDHSQFETFQFLFNVYQQIFEKTKAPYFNYENISSPLYQSFRLNDSQISLAHGEKSLKNYLCEFVVNCNEVFISDLFLKYKNTDNVSILILLVKGLNSRPMFYKNEIVELVNILSNKKVFNGSDDNFQLELRQLISNVYSCLNEEQTVFINSILLNIKSTYDYRVFTDNDGNKKFFVQSFGKKKYLFIKALPINDLKKDKVLFKTYQELQRKFGEIDCQKALHVSKSEWGAVGPPLKDSAYKNMNLHSWRKSMIKYNENYKSTEWLKGGIRDHSIAFGNTVRENPEKFYDFIDSLFTDKEVSHQYIISGIGALIEGVYNPEKVKKLYKKFLLLNLNDVLHKSLLNHQASYFVKNKNIDLDIVLYLRNVAVHYLEYEKELNPNNPLFDGINSIKESALYELMKCYYDKEFEEIIFSTIENVIKNPLCNNSIKVMILYNLAYLNNLNIERAFKIFIELTDTDNIEILKSSLNPAQYFNNRYHVEMHNYFDKILETSELHKKSFVMVSSWIIGLDKEKELYNKFINKGKDAKLCAMDVAEEFLINKDESVNSKALSILSEFLIETDKDFAGEYSGTILRKFKLKNFLYFQSFLQDYSKSVVCKKEPSYFLQYLLKCSKDYPKICIELLDNMDFNIAPNIQERGYYDKEPVQLILGIYSKLVSEINKDKKLINKALNIFDNMLKNNHLRYSASQSIESML